jgi:hypothetical protein
MATLFTASEGGVRRVIDRAMHALGMTADAPPRETILIRDGLFCGRRFEWEDFSAVWFAEENQVKFYGPDGAVLRVLAVETPTDAPIARAA